MNIRKDLLSRVWRRAGAAIVLLLLLAPTAMATERGRVVGVVDGDTIKVSLDGRTETVRLTGVDTPETVHPNRPVEHFGKEASAFTQSRLNGQTVRLEVDPQGDTRDRYGRLLRYVYLEDGTLFNAVLIREGYAHAYTNFPFSKLDEFRLLERQARESGAGLWAKTSDQELFDQAAKRDETTAPKETAGSQTEQTVYVTRTGAKYHRDGCQYLRSSKIAMGLAAAVAAGHTACSRCRPPSATGAVTNPGVAPVPSTAPSNSSGQCAATTKRGTRCKRKASAGSSYCWQHK